MLLWRQWTRGMRVLIRRTAADAELAEEVQHYVDSATEAHLACGLSAAEARRAARMEIGNVTVVQEQVRGDAWEHIVVTTLADARYAVRGLRAARGFTS